MSKMEKEKSIKGYPAKNQDGVPEAQVVGVGSPGTAFRASYDLPSYTQQTDFTQDQIEALKDQGFTNGLIKSLASTKAEFPLRIWIVDNSGSMMKGDGSRLMIDPFTRDIRVEPSSRWIELQDCIEYHAEFAALVQAPTSFCLLNIPGSEVGNEKQRFGIAETTNDKNLVEQEVKNAQSIMRDSKCWGKTPLTQRIVEIQCSLSAMGQQLNGRRVAVVIATDGLPTEKGDYDPKVACDNFVHALKSLEGLPVWVVIRLCTDSRNVVEFYQGLDDELELPIDLLDDFVSEGTEVYKKNKWLNYALPLHRCRELGLRHRVFDLIDEAPLTKDQLRDLCAFLFGVSKKDVPDPQVSWPAFTQEVARLLEAEKEHWNPAKKMLTPWIDMKQLERTYGTDVVCDCTIL